MCATARGSTRTSRGWNMKASGVEESDGDEAFSVTAEAIRCLKASG